MGSNTKIEWTEATWTPVRAIREDDGKTGAHCEKVSPGCKNCYAERLNMRSLPYNGTGLEFTVLNRETVQIIVDEELLLKPFKMKHSRNIFVCSQTDLFGDFVDDYQIAQVFAVMAVAHWHTFQVLTKRTERMSALLNSSEFWDLVDSLMHEAIEEAVDPLERRIDDLRATAPEVDPETPLANVWLGTSAESHEWALKRIPWLNSTPAIKRFVSLEPLLGPIDIDLFLQLGLLNWVIVGGESGPGARPMHPDWARLLLTQCQDAEVPFFFKQWGEWLPWDQRDPNKESHWHSKQVKTMQIDGQTFTGETTGWAVMNKSLGMCPTYRVGKKAAGRLLDGREWNEVPA